MVSHTFNKSALGIVTSGSWVGEETCLLDNELHQFYSAVCETEVMALEIRVEDFMAKIAPEIRREVEARVYDKLYLFRDKMNRVNTVKRTIEEMDPLTKNLAATVNHLQRMYPSSTLELHKKLIHRTYQEKADRNPRKILALMNGRSESQREETDGIKFQGAEMHERTFKSQIHNKKKKIFQAYERSQERVEEDRFLHRKERTLFTLNYKDVKTKNDIEAERNEKVLRAANASQAALSFSPEAQNTRAVASALVEEQETSSNDRALEIPRRDIYKTLDMHVDLNSRSPPGLPTIQPNFSNKSLRQKRSTLPSIQSQPSTRPDFEFSPNQAVRSNICLSPKGIAPPFRNGRAESEARYAPTVTLPAIRQPNSSRNGKILRFSDRNAHDDLKRQLLLEYSKNKRQFSGVSQVPMSGEIAFLESVMEISTQKKRMPVAKFQSFNPQRSSESI